MPVGSGRNGGSVSTTNEERPVLYQKYFKSGTRTYATQIKLSQNGKKYLVLTEGVRDPETQQLKKHTICVFEQDLKEFFAMLQETVVFLRTVRDPGNTVAGVVAAKSEPAAKSAGKPVLGAAKPAASSPKVAVKPAAKPAAARPVAAKSAAKPAAPTRSRGR